VDPEAVIKALHADFVDAGYACTALDAERVFIRARDESATLSVTTRAAGTVLVVTLEVARGAVPDVPRYRLTRQSTPRGQARAVEELKLGEAAFDDVWAIEANASAAPALHALKELLAPLEPYDASVDCDAHDRAVIEVRSGTGGRSFSSATVHEIGGALRALWIHLSAKPRRRDFDEERRAEEQVVAARLAGIEAVVADAAALFSGTPTRVGGALEARVALPLASDELVAMLRVAAGRTEGEWVVALEGAVGPGAPVVVVRKWLALFGARSVRVDAPVEIRDARAVRDLLTATTVDATIAAGRIRLDAACAKNALGRVVSGALEVWRLARGA
jgi:hypothetical protein